MKFWSVIMALVLVLASTEAWSQKRMGGGSSFGKQSSNVTQRGNPPAQPAQAPGQGTAQNTNTAQNPGMAPNAAPASRPWGAMLGGLAAGLGLAWLASSLGFGEEFGQILLWLLIGMVVLALVGFILRARAGAQKPRMAFQGAMGGTTGGAVGGQATVPGYNPGNVGNDASARPWERGTQFSPAPQPTGQGGSLIGSALSGPQTWGIPAGFDIEGFLRASKGNFIKLQDAWDRADIPALRALMTDEMVEQIQAQIEEREQQSGGVPNKTEVVMLEAQLLGIEELDGEYMASVEFSGMMHDESSAGSSPFREVWNITRPKTGSGGWLVAGVQALQ